MQLLPALLHTQHCRAPRGAYIPDTTVGMLEQLQSACPRLCRSKAGPGPLAYSSGAVCHKGAGFSPHPTKFCSPTTLAQ